MTVDDLLPILQRYRVYSHYRATSASKSTLYAVFKVGAERGRCQVTEPTTHGEAQEQRDRLIAADILALAALEVGQ